MAERDPLDSLPADARARLRKRAQPEWVAPMLATLTHRRFSRIHRRWAATTQCDWVKPKLVAEIAFSEWTTAGKLRHPRFLGLREDKRAKEVVREG
jgi:ATP-dependent DNA ligase